MDSLNTDLCVKSQNDLNMRFEIQIKINSKLVKGSAQAFTLHLSTGLPALPPSFHPSLPAFLPF